MIAGQTSRSAAYHSTSARVRSHYIYRCYDADGLLLYIGCTTNPKRRMSAHKNGHTSQASRLLAACMDRYEVDEDSYETRDAGRDAEQAAIEAEQPLFNIQGRRSVPTWLAHIAMRRYLRERDIDHVGLLRPIRELDEQIDEWFAEEDADNA